VKAAQSLLALNGGPAVRSAPWPGRGLIGPEEKAAVDAYLNDVIAGPGYISYGGPEEEAYCREFCETLGGGYADAVNSGTTALYVALRALDLPALSEVIVGAVTDPGGLMPVPLLGLIPMIADSVPGRYNTGPEQVAELITPRTSAIVVAHIGGEPADMPGIMAVAERHGLPVVEDCAQAHGATIGGRPVGAFGTMAAFSTMWGKHHSTGGQGGVVYTHDEDLYWRARRAADRGKPFNLEGPGGNRIASLNFNFMELAAVIGRAQLRKLPGIVAHRRALAQPLLEALAGMAVLAPPEVLPGTEPSWWFLRVRFRPERAACDKATFCAALAAEGLPINPDYRGALPHRMEWFTRRRVFVDSGFPWTSPDYAGDRDRQFPCPNAEETMDTTFNLHFHEGWGEQEVADAVEIMRKVEEAFRL
jgi:dTDP-4-amino-4,6-dideoxygalactose transaminase